MKKIRFYMICLTIFALTLIISLPIFAVENASEQRNIASPQKKDNFLENRDQQLLANVQTNSENIEILPNSFIDLEIYPGIIEVNFTPTKTANYSFTSTNYTYLEIRDAASWGDVYVNWSNQTDGVNAYLEKDTTYHILVWGSDYGTARLSVEEAVMKEITINNPHIIKINGNIVVKFTPVSSGYYNLVADNLMSSIPNNGSYSHPYIMMFTDDGKSIVSGEKLRFHALAGKNYYYHLIPNLGNMYTKVHIVQKLQDQQSISVNDSIDIIMGNQKVENEDYIFTPEVTGVYRFFTSPYMGSGTENNSTLSLMRVVDSVDNLQWIIREDPPSKDVLRTLNAGETYIIRVKSRFNFISNTRLNLRHITIKNYVYDDAGRLDYITYNSGGKLDYQYDNNGNLVKKEFIQ